MKNIKHYLVLFYTKFHLLHCCVINSLFFYLYFYISTIPSFFFTSFSKGDFPGFQDKPTQQVHVKRRFLHPQQIYLMPVVLGGVNGQKKKDTFTVNIIDNVYASVGKLLSDLYTLSCDLWA